MIILFFFYHITLLHIFHFIFTTIFISDICRRNVKLYGPINKTVNLLMHAPYSYHSNKPQITQKNCQLKPKVTYSAILYRVDEP